MARQGWRPDWAVPPGEVLAEVLRERDLSQSQLARRMDRPVKTVNEIINAKAALTPETAIQLEFALGIPAAMWSGLEAVYREHLARQRLQSELSEHEAWAKQFPVRALVKEDLIPRGLQGAERVGALLSFFGVSSPAGWEREWQQAAAAFRISPAFRQSPHAVTAWLRWGDLLAAKIETQPFDNTRFREALSEARGLTRRDPALVIETLGELSAEAGVALVLAPELGETRLSGAARWATPTKAILQLSLRHKTDDQFWFSFFHEAAHLLERRRVAVVDGFEIHEGVAVDEREQAADRWARNFLIPAPPYERFTAAGDFSAPAVRAFARDQRLAPGLVVGRLQRDQFIEYSKLNSLKKSIRWA